MRCPMLMEVVDALKRDDFAAAETKLRGEIRAHPDDIEAMSFLDVALDSQNEFAQADSFPGWAV